MSHTRSPGLDESPGWFVGISVKGRLILPQWRSGRLLPQVGVKKHNTRRDGRPARQREPSRQSHAPAAAVSIPRRTSNIVGYQPSG